jgi:hypothetical protein
VPPGAKRYIWENLCRQGLKGIFGEICAARGMIGNLGKLCRQGLKGIFGEIVPPRAKRYICGNLCRQGLKGIFGEICAARGMIVYRHVTPRGQD